MKRTSLLIAGMLVALAPVAAAWGKDVAGRYSLAGRNPGDSGSYSGTVPAPALRSVIPRALPPIR